MNKIIFISGPCGCGKSTFADAYAKYLVNQTGKSVYVIHGDHFHQGFVEPDAKDPFFSDGQPSDLVLWEDILRFNWDCILYAAERALHQGVDVVIDYVIETELPRVKALAKQFSIPLYYIVLTAAETEIESRIRSRGDADMIGRALFLKHELEAMPENQGHFLDNTGKSVQEEILEIDLDQYIV